MCWRDVFLLYHLSLSRLHSSIHSKIAAYYLSLLCRPEGRPRDIAAQGAAVCRSEQRWPLFCCGGHNSATYSCMVTARNGSAWVFFKFYNKN